MKIAICDDRPKERELLLSMLQEYCTSQGIAPVYFQFDSGEALLATFAKDAFSLVFLDIYMEGMSGIEAARQCKEIDNDCVIIFTTTSREHGSDAFEVEAFHYLVKPIQREKLFSVMSKWYDALCAVRTITIKCGRMTREVFVRDILYVEVLGRNCQIHTLKEVMEATASLSTIEELLPEGEFLRPIRYCLAALRHVENVGEETLLLTNGETLPISRREREKIRKTLASYRLQVLRKNAR